MSRVFDKFNRMDIQKALDKKEMQLGVAKYIFIMDTFWLVNSYNDYSFRVIYTDFYKLSIGTDQEFRNIYFQFLESSKNNGYRFEDVLKMLYDISGKIHGSFASKLIATVNPKLPIIDRFIKEHLELNSYYGISNSNEIINQYYEIINIYEGFLKTQKCKEWIYLFDQKFPNNNIENIKKIDFILWQMR